MNAVRDIAPYIGLAVLMALMLALALALVSANHSGRRWPR